MATQSPPKPDPKAEPETQSGPTDDLREYVVLASVITYRVGKGKKEVRRFVRGQRLRLHSEEERVRELVASKSIGIRGEKHQRATPAIVFAALGAPDDPALPPKQDVLPVVPDKTDAVAV